MALGGGIFTTQNKVLPGSYINFVSASKASANLSDRGIATMPLELDWGTDNAVFEVTPADFQKNSLAIFGYPFTHDKLKGLREVMDKVCTLYAYKLTSAGVKAANTYATAKCCGVRGNDLKVVIGANVDAPEKFDVSLYLGTTLVDTQTGVAKAADLVDNDYVIWKNSASLAETAGTALSGGTNGTVDGTAHQKYLDKIEPYTYNTMGVVTTDETTKSLYAAFVKRMREDVGAKFQCVLYNKAADYEGVINVKNRVLDEGASEASLVYWVTGAEAACAINKSLLNVKYDGAYTWVLTTSRVSWRALFAPACSRCTMSAAKPACSRTSTVLCPTPRARARKSSVTTSVSALWIRSQTTLRCCSTRAISARCRTMRLAV